MLPRRSSKAWPFWKPRMMPIRPRPWRGGCRRREQRQQVLVLADQLLHRGDVVHRLGKAFPDRYRAVGSVRPARRMSSNTDRSHLEMMRPSMTTLSRCRAFMMKSPLWDRGVHGAASCDRTPGRCQAGFWSILSEGGIRCFPAGRYLVQIRHGRLSSSDKRRPGGRQEGTARDRQGSAGRLKAGMRRRAGWPGMGCRRGAWAGRDRLRDRQDDKTGRAARRLVLRSRTGATSRRGAARDWLTSSSSCRRIRHW